MNSQEYWKQREEEALKHRITDEEEYSKRLNQIYTEMLDGVQNEINAFYGKYAKREGISINEAKKAVSELDIKAYERKAKRYVRDKDFSKEANEEMRLYNLTMKVNRLEILKANIGLELIAGHDELEKFMAGILKDRTMDELARQAGILGKTIKNNAQLANSIVNASYYNATFSQRIWMYNDMMKNDLGKMLKQGLIQGKGARELSKELRKYFIGEPKLKNGNDGAVFSAERLMRTELARVQTDAQKQSFERNGFKKYQFIVNGGCCPKCEQAAKKNGGVYDVKDMMPGENAPPLHCFCRCSTAAWEDSKDYDAWLNYLEGGGTTAGWNKMSAKDKKAFAKSKKTSTKSASGAKMKAKKLSEECKQLIESIKKWGVDFKEVEMHKKPLSNDAIVQALAGGDKTSGSCASVGLAYIGQKGGMNVLDFRDGESRAFFSTKYNLREIAKLPGAKTFTETARSSVTAGNKLLKLVEVGKEYYLCSGRHAAIVRKTDEGKLQYLELQSATRSGWTDFDGNPRYTLKHRFGENKGYDVTDFMIDIDSLKDSDDLKELLGYINTADDKQRKGKHGTIK